MDLLPAYVALQPWARGRRVLVVGPGDLRGAVVLRDAGAALVRVVDGPGSVEHGVEVADHWPQPSERFELIVAIEGYAQRGTDERRRWLQQAVSILPSDGWFVARAPHGGHSEVDFWTLETELGERFPHLFMLAQLPWHGVSLAPVLDGGDAPVMLELDETLVEAEPAASHYLALATQSPPDARMRQQIEGRCLLVPSGSSSGAPSVSPKEIHALREERERALSIASQRAQRVSVLELELQRRSSRVAALEREQAQHRDRAAEQASSSRMVESLQAELAAAREKARASQTDLQILSRQARDLEAASARANETSAARQVELDAKHDALEGMSAQVKSLEAERSSLTRQMEVALAEREGTRKLAQRVEAELELTRRRLAQHEGTLSERVAEVSQLTTEVQVARAELEHQRAMLSQAQSREEALSAEAAQTVEQGRMLAEVVADRDRVRDELGRRGQQIQALEERLWSSREELERARLDNVRAAGEAERLRERAERAHQSEASKGKELERLGAELHGLELERAELRATVRAHEDEISRLRAETESRAGDDEEEMGRLRTELAERTRAVAELKARGEQLAAREEEASGLARRREEQLSEIGEELERLRTSAEQNAATASSLEGELEVRALEVEQMAASVSDLQAQLEARRDALDAARAREEALQRDLEHARSEEESLRRRLREREQELEDFTSTTETTGIELYKLRRELEAAAEANEQLEQALEHSWPSEQPRLAPAGDDQWPSEAVDALRRLKAQLAAQARRHSEQLAARPSSTGQDPRVDRFRLEASVRAEEQEFMLRELDASEQRIWEMTDAADRNAARLAASLAQLEKVKEELDETRDELEVARKLLEAAEARALEQERLLASERARLARVGASPEQQSSFDEVDELFADLAGEDAMVRLGDGEAAAPVRRLRPDTGPKPAAEKAGVPQPVPDSSSSRQLGEDDGTRAPRIVVEALDDDGDDDPWETGVVTASNKKS